MRHVRVGLRSERGARRVNVRPERAYMRIGMANLRPGRVNSRLERAYVRLGKINLRSKRAYLKPGMADLRPMRINFEAWKGQFEA